MKTDFFQSCGHCWVFQLCWYIECSTFTASSFRIWNSSTAAAAKSLQLCPNLCDPMDCSPPGSSVHEIFQARVLEWGAIVFSDSSTGIPSIPLALFIVMPPKAHLISHSRMSGSMWVIRSPWLSVWWISFLYSSSVYSWKPLLISSASVRSISFLSFIEPVFAWNVPLLSLIFLKRSLVFPILLFSSISLHWLLKKTFLSLLAFLWNSAFKWIHLSFSPLLFTSLLFTAICKASSDNHFAFLHFLGEMVLIPVSCTMSWTSVHSSSGTLSDLVP